MIGDTNASLTDYELLGRFTGWKNATGTNTAGLNRGSLTTKGAEFFTYSDAKLTVLQDCEVYVIIGTCAGSSSNATNYAALLVNGNEVGRASQSSSVAVTEYMGKVSLTTGDVVSEEIYNGTAVRTARFTSIYLVGKR